MSQAKAETHMASVDGRDVCVTHWDAGEAGENALPVLFFNGIGANAELIAPFAERLGRNVITFDMPGIGNSPDPVWPYRPWMMARVANKILDDLGYADVDVMGISWGGAMAQQFAVQYGKRTNRLVLIATTAGMLMVPGKWSALSKMANPRRYVEPDYMLKNFNDLYGGQSKGSEAHVSRIKAPSMSGYFNQLFAMVGWTSAPFLPFLRHETLVLMGEEDAIVRPINGRILETLIPNAQMVTIKDGGHLFLMSHSEECVPLIQGFLDNGHAAKAKAA
jgi:poly(3-hydroxyalkanoate) depolymerase